ncbi:fimbrial protein [Lysobacter panacisoli]|uniref:Fimbrial protein n=1 Tax=Lysobacter panacisoli TaxID=1255263 RepID=A0ABP9L3N2_9GAMM|nr:fimbrial protein [Lysobacter panacisoli]
MKKTLLSAVLASTFVAAIAPAAAFASDGTITFTGNIVANTCTIKNIGGDDPNAKDFTVLLPNVQNTGLSTANVKAGATNFSLVLGGPGQTGCVDNKTAYVYWEPSSPQINPTTGGLKNTGTATNVEVVLMNRATGAEINLNQSTGPANPTAVITGNTAQLDFQAAYKAIGGAATAGTVNTNVTYTVAYN